MSYDILTEAFSVASGVEFEEVPVDVETFVTDPQYMDLPPLSDYQLELIRKGSQIYRRETLDMLYDVEEAERRWQDTKQEVIFFLGKGCHAPYTPVFDAESGNWKRLDSFNSDSRVLSSDGISHYATEAFKEGHGRMLRVKTALGFEEDVYVGHKYFSFKKSRFYKRHEREYKADFNLVSDLSVGDRIGIQVGFDVDAPVNIPVEHAELIGYWLGDGMLPTDSNPIINMDFCSDETESIARYEELCAEIGDTPTKSIHPTKNMTIFRHGRNSKAVVLAREYGLWGMRSKTKRIPDAVWSSNNDILSATVSKLWQTDGCVYKKNGITAEFCSVSRQLATDVQRALLRLGVPASIRFRIPKSNFSNASETGYVTVSSDESIRAFYESVSLLDHKRPVLPIKTGRVYSRLEDGIYYDRIISIEDIGEGDYWTLTVPDTGNYVGNGMISANSGKDFCSTILVCYIAYLLLCLKDPQKYYNKPAGDNIDIMNIAINAQQASRVFFKGVKDRLKSSPWFQGKYEIKRDEINFDKSINLISGHSEAESLEGYNVICVVLDEIAGFAMENKSGNKKAKTADAIYNMHRASVTSRFPEEGKLILLSFSRYDGDFMTKRYNEVIAEKEVIKRSKVLKLDADLPDGMPGNEITVEWDEDHILRYKEPGTFALRRPSWYVNPTKSIENYTRDFFKDKGEALTRFACMPTASKEDAFFPSKEKLDSAFVLDNAMDENGVFLSTFKPKPGTKYFVHVDLAQKHDRCAVSMAHVDSWTDKSIHGLNYHETLPTVIIDSVKFWQPLPGDSIDFQQVIDHILALRRRGFDIQLVTFDNWNSHDTRNNLEALGIPTGKLSIKVDQYNEFKVMVYDDRCFGPNLEELVKELKELRWINGKVDHPRSGYNDLSDSVAGAVYNAIAHTAKPVAREVEVHTGLDMARKYREEEAKKKTYAPGTIVAPTRREMPQELQDYLNSKAG